MKKNFNVFVRIERNHYLVQWELNMKTIEYTQYDFDKMISKLVEQNKNLKYAIDVDVYTNVYIIDKHHSGILTQSKIAYIKNGTLYTH